MRRFEAVLAVGIVVIVLGSLFVGFMASSIFSEGIETSHRAGGGGGTYHLTLLVSTNNWFSNLVGMQPAFYVVQNNHLLSSANITLPANVPINITIINFDDGSAPTDAQFANVTGTVGNVVYIANDSNINSTTAGGSGSGINIGAAQPVSYVNDSNIAHTFTIQLGTTTVVNIPIEPLSVETATFTLPDGVYHWHCMAACGSGSSGWGGAMATNGWMGGVLDAE